MGFHHRINDPDGLGDGGVTEEALGSSDAGQAGDRVSDGVAREVLAFEGEAEGQGEKVGSQ